MRRWRAVLGVTRTDYPNILIRGQAVYDGQHNNPNAFVSPNPPLAVLLVKIQNLAKSQAKVGTRTNGASQARDVDANALFTSMETSRAYVQELSDALPPDQAASLIKLGGFLLGNDATYTKPLLMATQAQPSAPVHLEAYVAELTAGVRGKVFFNWGFSADGGLTWNGAPSTPHGRTDIPDLKPLVTYQFRVSITAGGGMREWAQDVSFLVR
jgi:hypothetical protein